MITPQVEAPETAKELGLPKLYFKREDLHPLGSHKGRSIPSMIDIKAARGAKDFAISSSGNAAIAAARHIEKRNHAGDDLTLTIFTGEHMNEEKRRLLMEGIFDERIKIETSPRPLQSLFKLVTGNKAESLRQSTDDDALPGYKALADEIAGTPDLKAVFIGTSSGTAAQALADYFAERKKDVEIHVVQTSSVSPIASGFDRDEPPTEKSLADAIIDIVAHRKDKLAQAIENSKGSGWIATNDDIKEAQRLLRKSGIETTPNGALGFAGLLRALKKGRTFNGPVVCIITGR
jgi:threonine synthase